MSKTLLHRLITRPRHALAGLFFFVLVAGAFGGPVAGALYSSGGFVPEGSDSVRAVERVETATGVGAAPSLAVLVDDADPARVGDVTARLSGVDGVARVTPGGASEDGTSTLVLGTLDAEAVDDDVAAEAIEEFADDGDVTVGGEAVAGLQIGETVGKDLARAELLAMPLLLLLSLIFFGGRAALLPMVVGLTTVLGTFLVLAGVNQVYGLSVFALNLVIGLGLGLAIDYTLFLLTRYREELQRQGATHGAIRTTLQTAGRTVVFSAATVAVALATLTVFPMGFTKSMGIAGAIVAGLAATASLVITPIFFALRGARLARRSAARSAAAGRWYRFSHAVMRRPGRVAAATAVVMVALSAPALRTEWTPIDATVVPTDQSARIVSDRLSQEYGGTGTTPVTVAMEADDPAQVAEYAAQAGAVTGVRAPAEPLELGDGTWQLALPVEGATAGSTAQDVVAGLRDLRVDGVDALVGGPAASFIDQQAAIGASLPLAVSLLVLLTLIVLWLMTGSVVLPLKAVVMNTLTVGVALGALTFVYQGGRLTGLLGYTPNGGVEPTDFLVTAALVFALSTDYGVFLLGRIKEERDAGLTEREAVATGLGHTGAVVTAAALLLAVAIGAFSTSSISFIQQIGVATAVGVLVDAFVVRSLLVPSLMGLLGKWNWWAPVWLRRLHDRVGLSERPVARTEERARVLADTP
ncbi:MMPL family transporter [Nocardioides sp. cx-169]|uniref:MMPL family transporter n=1 Tax=Nocardioides sp. cx-169 TaxID=2899080 RepID=UPI001E34ED82|nr:MMPL family transporter [Nocardioides sp. cx-169]MCD4532604.1 MMPL family transporter [Nocardioides sp. cx-169]